MRAIPIPSQFVWEDGDRVVVGPPPEEDLTGNIRAVEAVVDNVEISGEQWRRYNLLIALDPGDIEALQEKGQFWLSFLGAQMVPFDIALVPSGVEDIARGT